MIEESEKQTLQLLETLEGYRQHFMDVNLWHPHVEKVCQSQGLTCQEIRPGLAGTFPTFVIDNHYVIKFFGRLFNGMLGFETEWQVNMLLKQATDIPTPQVIARGQLFNFVDNWPWPYLIFEYITGTSIGEVYEQVPFKQKVMLTRKIGILTRQLHELKPQDLSCFETTWVVFTNFLEQQRERCTDNQREWGTLPKHLLSQIEDYLPPVADIVDLSLPAHIIHADLTRDHIMGRFENGRWEMLAIIDFGDTMVGDIFYELIALHLDLFNCDKRLLRTFLKSYGWSKTVEKEFALKAMAMTLLHQFDVLCPVIERQPTLRQVSGLEEMASMLWEVRR